MSVTSSNLHETSSKPVKCVHGCMHLPFHLYDIYLWYIFPLSSLQETTWNTTPPSCSQWKNKRCHLWEQLLPRVGQWALKELGKAFQRSDSSKHRLCIFPWKLIVYTSSVKMVICKTFVPTTFPLLQKLIYPTFPTGLLRVVSQGYLRCCLLGLRPNFTPNKTKLSTFRLYFFIQHTIYI